MQLVTSLAFLAIAATSVFAQGPQINTPASITECQPTQLTYSGGTPPYFISILPGGQVSAAPIEDLGSVTGTSLTWNADIASGTPITFQIKDSLGSTAFSAIVTVQAGSSTSCVGKNSVSSGSASGTASGTPASSASSASGASSASSSAVTSAASVSQGSSAAATPASTAGGASTSKAASATSAGASASASTSKSAAMPLSIGSAPGIIGMLLAAFLA